MMLGLWFVLAMFLGVSMVMVTTQQTMLETMWENQAVRHWSNGCWSSIFVCQKWSAYGTGTHWEPCKLRCMCLGFQTGRCVKTDECTSVPGFPWMCECSGLRQGLEPAICKGIPVDDRLRHGKFSDS